MIAQSVSLEKERTMVKLHSLLNLSPLGFVALALLIATPAWAESAADANARGKALLTKADFQGAMQAFADAARADAGNQDYRGNFAMTRQVIALRDRLDKEQDAARWEYTAQALLDFYTIERIYPAALELSEKMHAKLNTASTARVLGETQMAMGKYAEAEKMLSALDAKKATLATESLRGLAMVRNGKTDEAAKIAKSLVVPEDAGARALYCDARLQAAVGNNAQAVELLRRCMENVPPSLQDGYREHARDCEEFASLSGSEAFAKALSVESKIAESKCSGGGQCAGCPNRAKCAKAQAQQ